MYELALVHVRDRGVEVPVDAIGVDEARPGREDRDDGDDRREETRQAPRVAELRRASPSVTSGSPRRGA